MNRRDFACTLGLAALGSLAASARASAQTPASSPSGRPVVAMLVYPGMILMDLVGPQTVLAIAGSDIHLVWKDQTPVRTDIGLPVAPTATFADCPRDLDVLFVPGGLGGTVALFDDDDALGFLRDRGGRAGYVTSVCTGSLALGAAGLLKGKRATSHWYVRDLLPLFGATVEKQRVVTDGRVMTGGGATAGLDFGLTLAARLRGEDEARRIQLLLEYDPDPPFRAGSPEGAGTAVTEALLGRQRPFIDKARAAAERAAARMPS